MTALPIEGDEAKSDGGQLSAGDFGVAFKGFLEQSVAQAPVQEPFFRARLTDHFGVAPTALPIELTKALLGVAAPGGRRPDCG